MPTNPNMVAIQTVTVGSGGAASIEFTNIPQTYTDLVIKASLRDTRTDSPVTDVALTFNNSATGYSMRMIYGDGSSAGSASSSGASRITGFYENTNQTTSNTFSNNEIYIPNYTSSNNKSVSIDGVAENNATTIYSSLVAGLWADSSAITSIKLVPAVGSLSYAQYSTATLYGVTSAAVGAKATGGIISQDANYFYHTFVASGTFTPTANLSCDYLVVAGGGAGGASGGQSHGGGGGGAGGYRTSTGFSTLANTNYTVTVGAGGAGNTTTKGGDGSNSVFSTITSDGGGGGGYGVDAGTNRQGNNGGSGGGSGSSNSASIAGGTGTSGQGNNGGDSGPAGVGRAGSGGGASAAGTTAATITTDTAGGAGTASSISGSSVTYAVGGGCNGTINTQFPSGTANTGNGGHGAYNGSGITQYAGGSGGSGIVIVRYAK
jgi:hypothetical protein